MLTRTQSRTFKKGTLAALDRSKERTKTVLEIDHASNIAGQSLVKSFMQWLAVSGTVSPSTTRITLISEGIQELQNALKRSERANKHINKRLEEALRKVDELMLASKQPPGERWVTLKEAAHELKCHYSTVWRAHHAGRLKTKVIGGGTKKEQLLCDPKTFVPTAAMLKKSQ